MNHYANLVAPIKIASWIRYPSGDKFLRGPAKFHIPTTTDIDLHHTSTTVNLVLLPPPHPLSTLRHTPYTNSTLHHTLYTYSTLHHTFYQIYITPHLLPLDYSPHFTTENCVS